MVRLVESMTGDHPARPVIVVSNRPDAGGLVRAARLGVPTAVVDHRAYRGARPAFEADLADVLEAVQPDVIALAGFMRILTPEFVQRFVGRMVNIHPSLLPAYPGLDTHARALQAGDTEAGCSVHEVTADLDAGPILGQGRVPILAGDTPQTLADRVLKMEHRLYPDVMRRFVTGNRTRLDLP